MTPLSGDGVLYLRYLTNVVSHIYCWSVYDVKLVNNRGGGGHECDTRMRYYICHHQTPLKRRECDLVLPNTFAISRLHEEAALLIKHLPEVSP